LLIELHEAGAEFLLVGGWAVILYGHVRATDDMAVEVLTKISGVTFDQALEDSKTFELDGYQIPYIGRAALIQNKKAAARHKDLADVEELERS
jgi:predicted nucleotidyltransferase